VKVKVSALSSMIACIMDGWRGEDRFEPRWRHHDHDHDHDPDVDCGPTALPSTGKAERSGSFFSWVWCSCRVSPVDDGSPDVQYCSSSSTDNGQAHGQTGRQADRLMGRDGRTKHLFFPQGPALQQHLETAAKPCWGPLIRQWPASMPRLPHLPHRRDETQNEWTRKRGERRAQRRGCVAEASPHQHMTSSPAMRCCCPALRCVCCDR